MREYIVVVVLYTWHSLFDLLLLCPQAMREYIRAASVVKLAKIRMWETDNTAMLQARYSPR